MTTLPKFDLFQPQTMPNRHREIVGRVENGMNIRLLSNWPQTRWWLCSRKNGFRMSWTLSTTSKAKADQWRRDVEAGEVRFEPDSLDEELEAEGVFERPDIRP